MRNRGLKTACPDDNIVTECMTTFLAHIMHEAAFNQLRTIEQLGYIVHVGQSNAEHKFFLRVIVQSSVMDAAGLDARIETFLRSYYRDFICDDDAADEDQSDLPKPDEKSEGPVLADGSVFTTYIESLCEKLEEPVINFNDDFNNMFSEISSCRYIFDRKMQMAQFLRELKLEDVKRFWNTYIRATDEVKDRGMQRCKFSSQFFGKGTNFPSQRCDSNVEYIRNSSEFKAMHSLEPAKFLPF